ncbi:hypothetical protein SALBM311S_12440 [Streptomyces alboniger]
MLALRPGRTVPASLLVDEVWDGDPPADATGALQALVGRLRRALGADAVASVDGGYRLTAPPDDIDLHRFERLAGDGTRALADGDPAKAAVVLDDALALWRGPALADLPDRTAEAARWETRRLDILRARHTAALALGHAGQSLPELTALCDSHPLDESLQTLRLRALRDAGRTAQALAAYEDVRQLLADRLGTDPGPELRQLHGELLRLSTGGADGAPSAPPPRLETVPHASATQAPGVGPGVPLGTAEPATPVGNLRARLTSFVGREADIETIRGDLAAARLVTLLGPGGAGKTRLSQEAAETVRAKERDGVWLAELAPVDDRTRCRRPCSPPWARVRPCCTVPARRPCGPPGASGTTTPSSGSPNTAAGAGCWSSSTTASMSSAPPPGCVQELLERDVHDRAATAARAVLGDEEYEAAYEEGGGLSPEEAAALI